MSLIRVYHQGIVSDLILWMNTHPDETLNTVAVARRAGFSLWHIQRIFKERTGVTLGRYIKTVRLGYAAIDLATSAGRVIDIALQYGYDSQPIFTRAMKSHLGLTPGAIKKLTAGDKARLCQKIRAEMKIAR